PEGTARVRARLRYRKLTRDYARAACATLADAQARARCLELPIVDIARDELALGPTGNGDCPPVAGPAASDDELRRRIGHGLALADGRVEQARDAEELLACAGIPAGNDLEAWLGLARVALAEGRIDDAVRFARGARAVRPDFPAAWLLEARA